MTTTKPLNIQGRCFAIHPEITPSTRATVESIIRRHGGVIWEERFTPPSFYEHVLVHPFVKHYDVDDQVIDYPGAMEFRHFSEFMDLQKSIIPQHKSDEIADLLVGYADGIMNKVYLIQNASHATQVGEGGTILKVELTLIEKSEVSESGE